MIGVVTLQDALERAAKAELDLVEVSPGAEPPVCKILDYGKFKYETQKRAHDARKKQKVGLTKIKEIKLRPGIGEHDYQVKLKSAKEFINDGDKVKVTLRFRGREITHQDVAFELMQRLQSDLLEIAKTELQPRLEGRQMVMMLAPQR
ncbi:MAG: Translation initiation factor 3 [Rickettsiales bacterium]|jgi:translation initiation factor IF-3|nr:Translation initiation factor 3 [Rickettsiales bacterium]